MQRLVSFAAMNQLQVVQKKANPLIAGNFDATVLTVGGSGADNVQVKRMTGSETFVTLKRIKLRRRSYLVKVLKFFLIETIKVM